MFRVSKDTLGMVETILYCIMDFFHFQGLGVPFNIASYSLLTYMIAHVCGLKVRSLSFQSILLINIVIFCH